MKNKKKWASILTIATSLVLCIISTFGITLAFFGGNASANLSTITLKTGIEIGAAIESSVGSAKVVPGQPVKITATGTVSATTKGNPTEANAVDGVVRAKFNVGNELGEVTIAGNSTDYWTDGNDGYYYLVTAENGTTLRTVSKGTSVQIFGDLVVSKNFTNADSGKSVEASVIFEVIQAGVYDSVTGNLVELTVANATSASSPLYSSFKAIEYVKQLKIDFIRESNIIEITTEMQEENLSESTGFAQTTTFEVSPYAVLDNEDGTMSIYYGFKIYDYAVEAFDNSLVMSDPKTLKSSLPGTTSSESPLSYTCLSYGPSFGKTTDFAVKKVEEYTDYTNKGTYLSGYTQAPGEYIVIVDYNYSSAIIHDISGELINDRITVTLSYDGLM